MNKVYLNNLKKQFLRAQGSTNEGIPYNEFEEYLIQLNILGKDYIKLISELGVDITDSGIVEVNKGIIDSVAYGNTNFSLITPYADNMVPIYENEIYKFKFLAKDGIPSFRTNSGVVYQVSRLIPGKHTFITQNPFDYDDIEDFSKISICNPYNTIFGMFGMNNDKDVCYKMKMFERVKSLSSEVMKEEIITEKDKYFWILGPQVKVKTKTR